jgi:hypothetical protein
MTAVTVDVGPHLTAIALAAAAYASLRLAFTWSSERRRNRAETQPTPTNVAGETPPRPPLPVADPAIVVCEIVARCYRTSVKEMLSATRAQPATRARQVAMRLIRELTGSSYPEIGARFGRDHSTVMHALAVTDGMLLEDLREQARAALGSGAERPPRPPAGRRLAAGRWHRTGARR